MRDLKLKNLILLNLWPGKSLLRGKIMGELQEDVTRWCEWTITVKRCALPCKMR